MAKKKPVTTDDMEAFLDKIEAIKGAASDLNDRLFQSIEDDYGSPVKAFAAVSQAMEALATLNRKLAAQASNAEYKRDLEAKLRAEMAKQKA